MSRKRRIPSRRGFDRAADFRERTERHMANSEGVITQALTEPYAPIGISVWGHGLFPALASVTVQGTGEVMSRAEFAERYPQGAVLSIHVIPSRYLEYCSAWETYPPPPEWSDPVPLDQSAVPRARLGSDADFQQAMRGNYPLLYAAGLSVSTEQIGMPGVPVAQLRRVLEDRGLTSAWEDFASGSTRGANGAYPWDVERFLEQHAGRQD